MEPGHQPRLSSQIGLGMASKCDQRTGNALLRVRATDCGRYILNVIGFLEEYWTRIQHLDVDFSLTLRWPSIESLIWGLLQQPVKHMETFMFRIPIQRFEVVFGQWKDVVAPDGFKLFGNQAPALKTYIAPSTTMDSSSPNLWLTNIREFSAHGPLPVDQLLRACLRCHPSKSSA
ncbi:hypothetical protein CPB84DRAFT_208366 [Gymnopilus junonius]|uniref:Uncharacterized protein n=1 Tax=Gymnopilus junonius TaxID=109634 RepID=A0A9P5NX33_GYMJU|nr:hypothetical protein CPB84DRAFT_208366 [Gymnopilus junonius]